MNARGTLIMFVAFTVIGLTLGIVARHYQRPICPPISTSVPQSPTRLVFTAADGATLEIQIDGRRWTAVAREGR